MKRNIQIEEDLTDKIEKDRQERRDFVKYLKVYGRTNKPCPGCKNSQVKKTKVAGRGTHFCPKCQR
jgi:formamidopyrimidine-DNA glycosylase